MNSYSIETGAAFVLYLAAMMGIGLFLLAEDKNGERIHTWEP